MFTVVFINILNEHLFLYFQNTTRIPEMLGRFFKFE